MKKYWVILALGCLVTSTVPVRAQNIMPGEEEINTLSNLEKTAQDVVENQPAAPEIPVPTDEPAAEPVSTPAPVDVAPEPQTPPPAAAPTPTFQVPPGGGLPRVELPNIKPTQTIEEPYSEDAFGVVVSGSLKTKQSETAAVTYKRSLKNIIASLAIQGYSPNREVIINSMIFKVKNKFVVSYSDEEYILEIKSITPENIIFSWDKDDKTQKYEFPDLAMPEKVSEKDDMDLINEKKPTIVIDEKPTEDKK